MIAAIRITVLIALVPFGITEVIWMRATLLYKRSRAIPPAERRTANLLSIIWILFGIMWAIVGVWMVLSAAGAPSSIAYFVLLTAFIPLVSMFVLVAVARFRGIPLRPIPSGSGDRAGDSGGLASQA